MAMSRARKKTVFEAGRYTILVIWLLIVAFPMFWVISTSFKPDHEWFAWPPVYWSQEPTLNNYLNV